MPLCGHTLVWPHRQGRIESMNAGLLYKLMPLAMVLLVATGIKTYAGETQPVCNECHKSLSDLLKQHPTKLDSSSHCFNCHDSKSKAGSLGQKAHQKHIDAMGVSENTCLSCHKPDAENKISVSRKAGITFNRDEMTGLVKKYETWNNSQLLANSHKTKGVYCLSCHEGFGPDDVDDMSKRCKSCHGGYEELARKTVSVKPRNPHKSHFATLSCVQCHQIHAEFRDYCDKCHHTNFKWTRKGK